MNRRILCVTLGLGLAATIAHAEPYWVEWTGDTFPETEGWTRYSSDPPAERWLDDGKLFIDSRADWFMSEHYWFPRPGMMTLADNETFVYRWCVRVDEVTVDEDPGVGLRSDDQYTVIFDLGVDHVESLYEPDKSASFTPGEYHDFCFVSSDMRTYSLHIDSELAFEGVFFATTFSGAGVDWGDITTHRSLSAWDHIEFGIVPEPTFTLYLLSLCPLLLTRRSVAI